MWRIGLSPCPEMSMVYERSGLNRGAASGDVALEECRREDAPGERARPHQGGKTAADDADAADVATPPSLVIRYHDRDPAGIPSHHERRRTTRGHR
jgi:hypothetical protein